MYLHDKTASYSLTLYLQIQFQQESAQFLTRHPMNTKREGKPTTTLSLLVFSDETSGNMTKKWNRFETFSMSLAGLPWKEIRKIENIRFLGMSNIVPFVPLKKSIANYLQGTQINRVIRTKKLYGAMYTQKKCDCSTMISICTFFKYSYFRT